MSILYGSISLQEASVKYDIRPEHVKYLYDKGWKILPDNDRLIEGIVKEAEFYYLVTTKTDWTITVAKTGTRTHNFTINGIKTKLTKRTQTLDEHIFQLVQTNEVSLILWDNEGYYYVNEICSRSKILTNQYTKNEYRSVSYSLSTIKLPDRKIVRPYAREA